MVYRKLCKEDRVDFYREGISAASSEKWERYWGGAKAPLTTDQRLCSSTVG